MHVRHGLQQQELQSLPVLANSLASLPYLLLI
jgi:hypothetical protein